MKIVSICQNPPNPIHESWIKSLVDKNNLIFDYIPSSIINNKAIIKMVWFNSILNQFLAALQAINIPKADLFLVEGFKAMLPALLNKKKGTKIALINSDTFLSNYKKKSLLVKMIYRWYIKNVDYFICTSKMMADMTSKYSSAPRCIVYPYYDKKRFKNAACNLSSSNICSIATARLCKRPDIMIEAFNLFCKKYHESKLFICDGGEYGGNGLLKSISILKQANVIIPNKTKQINPVPYLKKSGLYINTAEHESFGINILESMVAGIPPVISKFCGAKDLVEQVDPSLVCDLDPNKFADRLIELHQDTKRKSILSKKCKIIANKYTKHYSIGKFKETIEWIINDMKTKK